MSHITNIQPEFFSLDDLETAAKALGGVLHRGATEFQSYYGKESCEHKISFSNAKFEIGVVQNKQKGTYDLKLDFWSTGGLTQAVGNGANKLKVEYSVAAAQRQAQRKGFKIRRESKQDGGVRLVAYK